MEDTLKKQVLGVCLLGVMVGLTGVSAHAQGTSKFTVFGGYSYLDNNWGNGCVGSCIGGLSSQLHGYSISGVYNFNNHIGIEANFSGHNGTSTVDSEPATATENGYIDSENQDIYTYTFGPKLTQPIGNFAIFGHFLVGGDHGHEAFRDNCLQSSGSDSTCSSPSTASARGSGFAFKTGGGVDWNHGRWGVRILKVDLVHASTFATEVCAGCTPYSFNISGNNFELATGITVNLGGIK